MCIIGIRLFGTIFARSSQKIYAAILARGNFGTSINKVTADACTRAVFRSIEKQMKKGCWMEMDIFADAIGEMGMNSQNKCSMVNKC